jgi:hypothetical protein
MWMIYIRKAAVLFKKNKENKKKKKHASYYRVLVFAEWNTVVHTCMHAYKGGGSTEPEAGMRGGGNGNTFLFLGSAKSRDLFL